ncbi:MAG: shikimate dehydrogenase [Elusimicrobia bacterium RIFOXYA2_FULL_50_26]|nr:MAG: shikimate dehydrogenase [Elusimicrobia bacterium RIFOXYA2_FULL_50_26]OGS23701.1 MAG: shikimate dehydrogenase [Elusimicrobia bacterium RIFOXYB2_FULL_50_12]
MTIINGSTFITGIFGYPVSHTLSPAMHNAAFDALSINAAYLPFEVKPQALREAIGSLRSLNIKGVNITIPHKTAALKYLDTVDTLAKRIGSVNTIVNEGGKLAGYNTDATGFLKDIIELGMDPKRASCLLLGAGGAGNAVAAALAQRGAKKIFIADSDILRARKLADRTPGASAVAMRAWKDKLPEVSLVVNATPVGMKKTDPALLEAREIPSGIFIYDLVYQHRTRLIEQAKKAKVKCANGLGMLLNQGALAFELWTGKKAPAAVMRRALLKTIKEVS